MIDTVVLLTAMIQLISCLFIHLRLSRCTQIDCWGVHIEREIVQDNSQTDTTDG